MYKFCENGDLDGVKAALGRGEDVNQIWQHGDCGNPTCSDNPNCDFKALPLQGAVKGNHSNVVALLLKQPGIDVNLRTFVGYTALNVACMLGRTNIVRQLLFAPGIDPEIPNDLGRTALMEASFFGHTGCASELMQWRKKQEQEKMLLQAMIKLEKKKNAERRREEELVQKMKVERGKEADRERVAEEKKKEEEKKKIGQGRGRNARKRKKEEEKRKRKEQEEGLKEHKKGLENDKDKLEVHMKGFEEEVKGLDWLQGQGLKQPDRGDNKKRIKEPKNLSLVEFMERQILDLEEELECPVCLEVATAAPIYKCPDDHLLCRCTVRSFDPYFTMFCCRICRPKLSECPQCRVSLGLSLKRLRGAERQAERLLALRVEKMTIT